MVAVMSPTEQVTQTVILHNVSWSLNFRSLPGWALRKFGATAKAR